MLDSANMSHPVWVRGLKLAHIAHKNICKMSHPVWVRGLKQHTVFSGWAQCTSHPVWVRGLKLVNAVKFSRVFFVAPRVGAWIETAI